MPARVVEWVESVPVAGRSAGPGCERLEVRVAATVDGLPPPLSADEAQGWRALHLWCQRVDDVDDLVDFDGLGLDYLAVAIGGGLETDGSRQGLLDSLERVGASMSTPVLWHTSRGSVGQNLLHVRDSLRARPGLRLALDFPEFYCSQDVLLSYGLWKAVFAEIAPLTSALIVGDGDAARTPLAPRQEGLAALPPRWLYTRRQRLMVRSVAPPVVCWRTNRSGAKPAARGRPPR